MTPWYRATESKGDHADRDQDREGGDGHGNQQCPGLAHVNHSYRKLHHHTQRDERKPAKGMHIEVDVGNAFGTGVFNAQIGRHEGLELGLVQSIARQENNGAKFSEWFADSRPNIHHMEILNLSRAGCPVGSRPD